jgi:hypothetical protein
MSRPELSVCACATRRVQQHHCKKHSLLYFTHDEIEPCASTQCARCHQQAVDSAERRPRGITVTVSGRLQSGRLGTYTTHTHQSALCYAHAVLPPAEPLRAAASCFETATAAPAAYISAPGTAQRPRLCRGTPSPVAPCSVKS